MTGLYPNISHAEYHGIEAVSNSYLTKINHCPASAKIDQEDTPALIFGSAFHALVLEGQEAFDNRFVVAPEINRRTKAGQAEYAEFCTQNEGKAVIGKDDYNLMIDMLNAVIRHPFACRVLSEGRSEMSVFWEDEETGIYCKCRPDRVPDGDYGVIVDVKTTISAKQKAFENSCIKYGYDRQAAMYLDGYNAATKSNVDSFIFIAVEKTVPFMVGCYAISETDIAVGRIKYQELMKKELGYRERNEWPHYEDEGLVEMNLPNRW